MASKNLLEITEANFDAEVVKSSVPVLVDFWAEWCPPCRALTPIIEKLADAYAGKVKIGKVDTDANRNLAIKFNIQTIPALLIFKNGELVQRYGFKAEAELRQALDSVL